MYFECICKILNLSVSDSCHMYATLIMNNCIYYVRYLYILKMFQWYLHIPSMFIIADILPLSVFTATALGSPSPCQCVNCALYTMPNSPVLDSRQLCMHMYCACAYNIILWKCSRKCLTFAWMCLWVQVYVCAFVCVCVCVCIHVYVHMCVCAYMHVCVCVHKGVSIHTNFYPQIYPTILSLF